MQAAWKFLLVSKTSKSSWLDVRLLPGGNFDWANFLNAWHYMHSSTSFDLFPLPPSSAFLWPSLFLLWKHCFSSLKRSSIVLTPLVSSRTVTATVQRRNWNSSPSHHGSTCWMFAVRERELLVLEPISAALLSLDLSLMQLLCFTAQLWWGFRAKIPLSLSSR